MGKLSSFPSRLGRLPDRLGTPPKKAESFYQSSEWRSLMSLLKRTRGNKCQRCGATGIILGDHIHERKDGGAELDPANVELLCLPCHNTKTAKAKAARAAGVT
ncbi:HNH endonuclease signature motif containing protein [Agrobacterium tumefaciens]|uniref:HNH endonuclease signature motif containing protein n=1 Tax=Agrobacterium tumefaciens TaxID=358 RepID=UPI000DD71B81